MGFSEEQSRIALAAAKNNVSRAIEMIMREEESKKDKKETPDTVTIMSHFSRGIENPPSTPIAMYAVDALLSHVDSGASSEFDRQSLITNAFLEGVSNFQVETAACVSSQQHSSVEEVLKRIPYLNSSLNRISGTLCGVLTDSLVFQNLLDAVYSQASQNGNKKHIAVLLTVSPETVGIVLPPRESAGGSYFFFDSHNRPSIGIRGCYLVQTYSIAGVVGRLQAAFQTFKHSDPTASTKVEAIVFEKGDPKILKRQDVKKEIIHLEMAEKACALPLFTAGGGARERLDENQQSIAVIPPESSPVSPDIGYIDCAIVDEDDYVVV